MRQISLDGRIGKDAEVGKTVTGKQYVRFSVANTYFTGKEEHTDWYEVTSYDPYVVENRVKYLSKGRYVIVHGDIKTEVNTKNGKLYLNYYVTANNIDTPSFGSKKDDSAEEQTVSTLTGSTEYSTTITSEKPNVEVKATQVSPNVDVVVAQPSFATLGETNDDDLPF